MSFDLRLWSQSEALRSFLIRLASILSVVAIKRWTGPYYPEVFASVLFCHYILQIFYSKKKISTFIGNPQTYLPLLVVSAITGVSIVTSVPTISFVFGVHFALTEAYALAYPTSPKRNEALAALRFVLQLLVYFFLLEEPSDRGRLAILYGAPWAALLLAYLSILLAGGLGPRGERRSHVLRLLGHEFSTIPLVLALCFSEIGLKDLIFYHLIWWYLYPLCKATLKEAVVSSALNGILIALFLLMMPSRGFFNWSTPSHWQYWSNSFGYVHIYFSFAIANFNPTWLRRLFGDVGVGPLCRRVPTQDGKNPQLV